MATRKDRQRGLKSTREDGRGPESSRKPGYLTRASISPAYTLDGIADPRRLAKEFDALMADLANQMNTIIQERLLTLDEAGRHHDPDFTDDRGRPTKIRRPDTEEDVSAEDLSKKDEVSGNLGGEGVDTIAAEKAVYAGGSTVEDKEPAEAGAEVTTGKSLTVLADRDAENISYAGGASVESKEPAEANAEVTTGKSLTVLADRDADNISETSGRKWAGASGADFVKGTDNLDDVGDGTTFKRMAAGYADASGRPNLLRRSAADLDPDDIAAQSEVASHVGGLNDDEVQPGKIPLGADHLSDWQRSGSPAQIEGGKIFSNTVDTNQLNASAVSRVKIADRAVDGDSFVEGVVDEYQTMGSTLSDAQWDAITA